MSRLVTNEENVYMREIGNLNRLEESPQEVLHMTGKVDMIISAEKRPKFFCPNMPPIHASESNFVRNSSSSLKSARKNILPNKLTLKSMTIDSSKDYSTSSSSEESSWDISTSQQSGTTACCTPNSTISEPIPASLLQLADNPVARTPSIKKHLKQSVSIDEQSSNGMMMVAPLQTAGNDVNGITNKHDNKIAAPNSDACAPTMISDVQIPDMSMFDLINQTSRLFVLKPATMGLKINCQIYRQKGIIYPEYKFYLENLDSNLLLMMSARRKKRSKTTCYVISSITFDLDDVEKYVETPIAKLKSNLLGTNFSLYDFGMKPPLAKTANPAATNTPNQLVLPSTNSSSTASLSKTESLSYINTRKSVDQCSDTNTSEESATYRKEYLSVNYEMNVLGVKGPRQMSVLVPGMDSKFNREDFVQYNSNETLSSAWKKIFTNLKSPSPVNPTTDSPIPSSSSPPSKLISIKRSLFQLSRAQSIDKSRDDHSGRPQPVNHEPSPKPKSEVRNVVKLVNKSPEWHKELNSFALDFHGRVTSASVKNFQIVHEANTDYVVMQFGKVNKDLYTCDYSYPFCALQAFALAITSLDNKLGCD